MSRSQSFCLNVVSTTALALILLNSAAAQSIDRIVSTNFAPGKTATLVAFGKGLKDALYVWTPFGEVARKPPDGEASDTTATFEGQLPATLTSGIYPVRVVKAQGISARRFLVVDDLSSFAAPDACEKNPPTAALPAMCCVEGQVNALKPKFYRLDLAKDQSISIEVFARRLDSPLDPVLRILSASGKELAFVDDTRGLAGDAQLKFTATSAGAHTLELRDVMYSGGNGHFFHLRVGQFPLCQGTYPRMTSPGTPVQFVGDHVTDGTTTFTTTGEELSAPVAAVSDSGSGIAAVVTAASAPLLEQEPNDTRETANTVEPSVSAIAGRLQSAGDVDWYQLSAEGPQHLCVTAHTRDVGSPADIVLQIYDSAGKKLQESDDAGDNDAQLSLSLPAAGNFFLAVRELSSRGGTACTYDLEVQPGGRIELATTVDVLAIPKNGTATMTVSVKRLGLGTAFQLEATNLPAGITSSPVTVSENQKSAIITLHATDAAADAFQKRIAIQASIAADAAPQPVLYIPAPPKDKNAPNYTLQRIQTGVFTFATGPAQFSLIAQPGAVTVPVAGEGKTTITASRTGEWKEPIELASAIPAAELPTGITIAAAKITENTAEITIKASDKAKPGRYSISLQGTLKKDKTTITQPVPTITLDVTPTAEVKS